MYIMNNLLVFSSVTLLWYHAEVYSGCLKLTDELTLYYLGLKCMTMIKQLLSGREIMFYFTFRHLDTVKNRQGSDKAMRKGKT